MGNLQKITKNPLNVRYSEKNNWLGQTGSYKGFCVFKDEFWGIRAAARIVLNYMKRGKKTVRDIISTYAPPNENNTDAYIKFVERAVHCSPNYEIADSYDFILLLSAMYSIESGVPIKSVHVSKIAKVVGWLSPEMKVAGLSFISEEVPASLIQVNKLGEIWCYKKNEFEPCEKWHTNLACLTCPMKDVKSKIESLNGNS